MKRLNNVSWKRLVLSIAAGSLIAVAMFAQQPAPTKGTDADLNNGRKLYVQHCQYCHGEDGDRVECTEIVPLAGLGRRPRADLVRTVQSRSYLLRGYSYEGADARDMTAFLLSLKGEKEFGDPGLRCPLPVLSHRYGLLAHYRIIDVRDAAAYAKGHIPNAQSWPAGVEDSERQPRTANLVGQRLGTFGVSPAMTIVIYDESVTPAAARLWWDLVRAGHKNVVILDGGFRQWAADGNEVTTVVTPVISTTYVSSEVMGALGADTSGSYPVLQLKAGSPQPSSGLFDWERTVVDGQLRTAPEIREYLSRVELHIPGSYRAEGSDGEASLLVYALRLLGHQAASYDPVSKVLITGK